MTLSPAPRGCYYALVADVRPFRALRIDPGLDLAAAICPPFDTISPEMQRALQERSPHNAVHIELPANGEGRYQRAAETLARWLERGILRRDGRPAFYLYRQTFQHATREYTRLLLFARLRLEPWSAGAVLPHEQTFGAPKEDRLRLLRATRLNTSPVFLLYRDLSRAVAQALEQAPVETPLADFTGDDGQRHVLLQVADEPSVRALAAALAGQTLYVADGHHRYETALGYLEERRAQAEGWTGEEPENFVMVGLTAADDPGLLVLPIHRVTNAGLPPVEAMARLADLFDMASFEGPPLALASALAQRSGSGPVFGLAAAGSRGLKLLTVRDGAAVDRLMPQDRSPAWRRLDYAIANRVVLQHCLGLSDDQMKDYSVLWFTEDSEEAVRQAREGRARYAVLLDPVPAERVLQIADSGERMPQKSTFFYPKLPTGLLFNPLEE